MKNSILLLLMAMPVFLLAQFPSSGNKQRLGYQTTSDGIIWRGVAADTAYKPIGLNFPYFQLDTVNAILRRYIATKGKWQVVGGSGAPTGAAGGDLTGTYPDPTIGNDKIISAYVLDGTLVNADLANQTIDSNKIKNGAITNVKLATNAVDSTKAANLSPNDLAQTGASPNDVLTWTGSKYAPRPSTGGVTSAVLADTAAAIRADFPSAGSTTLLPKYVPLFIHMGESNSGGYALNTDATPTELSVQSKYFIFNTTTRILEPLHIGVNNNLAHVGLNSTTHGWELEMANIARTTNTFKNDTVYLVQTGQGGSTVAQWSPGVSPFYFDTAMSRIKTTLALLRAQGKQPQIYVLYSQGINDSGTATNAWAASTKTIIANIKNNIGDVPILMTELIGAGVVHNANIYNQIAKKYNNVYYVNTPQTAVGDSLRDINHWSYIGMKKIANTMVRLMRDSVGFDFEYLRKNNGTYNLSPQIEALNSQSLLLRAGGETAVTINTSRQTQIGGSSTPYALLSVGRSGSNASQFQIHKGSDDGLFILSNSANDNYYQTGASFSGSAFVAKATAASVFNTAQADFIFNSNTGLTTGNTFTPTQVAKLNASGLKIGTGSVTTNYELDVAGDATLSGNLQTTGGFFRIASNANASFICYDRTDATKFMGFYSTSAVGRINSQAADLLTFDLTNNRVSNGLTTITANFHLKAGTATASTAPLKFTSGTNLTTPEAGAVEYDGTEFYATNSTALRTVLIRGYKGSGSPESVVTAPVGSIYQNSAGGAGTTFYVKESGTGNTGWIGYSSTATGSAGGDLTGTYPNPTIGANKIISSYVLDGTLVNADLASQTLDSAKIKNRGITLLKLAASGATNSQVPKFNSTSGNWEAGSVTQVFTEEYNTVTSTTSPVTLSSTQADNLINQGGTQATFTLNMPASPVDGQVCYITFNNAISTLTIDGNGNTIVGSAVTTGVAGSQRKFKFYTGIGWIKQY